jgi:hypothetical protein
MSCLGLSLSCEMSSVGAGNRTWDVPNTAQVCECHCNQAENEKSYDGDNIQLIMMIMTKRWM